MYERMLDKFKVPTEEEIHSYIGKDKVDLMEYYQISRDKDKTK